MSGAWVWLSTSWSWAVSASSSKVPPQALDALDLALAALHYVFAHGSSF